MAVQLSHLNSWIRDQHEKRLALYYACCECQAGLIADGELSLFARTEVGRRQLRLLEATLSYSLSPMQLVPGWVGSLADAAILWLACWSLPRAVLERAVFKAAVEPQRLQQRAGGLIFIGCARVLALTALSAWLLLITRSRHDLKMVLAIMIVLAVMMLSTIHSVWRFTTTRGALEFVSVSVVKPRHCARDAMPGSMPGDQTLVGHSPATVSAHDGRGRSMM